MRELLDRRLSWILGLSFLFGLLCPSLGNVPSWTLSALVLGQIFFSSFKIALEDLSGLQFLPVLGFYLSRFVLIPSLVYLSLVSNFPELALALLLLCLVPSGVSSPSFSNLFGGNVTVSMLLVVISSLATPIVLPLLLSVLAHQTGTVDSIALFRTLLIVLVLPIAAHLPFRRNPLVVSFVKQNMSLLILPMNAATLVIPAAQNSAYLLSHPRQTFELFLISVFCYAIFYGLAWRVWKGQSHANRISFALASGANNISLGVVIAANNFPELVYRFLVVSNLSWLVGLILLRRMVRQRVSLKA